MPLSSTVIPVFAAAQPVIKESASGFYYIERTATQAALSAKDKDLSSLTAFTKDLDKDGELMSTKTARPRRAAKDIVSKMTLAEKTGALPLPALVVRMVRLLTSRSSMKFCTARKSGISWTGTALLCGTKSTT